MPKTIIIGHDGRLGQIVAMTFQERGDEMAHEGDETNYLVFCHRYRGPIDEQKEIHVNALWPIEVMKKQKWAGGDCAVVVVSSLDASEVALNQPMSYSVSKAALNQAVAYTARSQNVRINAVSPATFTGNAPQVDMHEVANVIAFLCSKQATGVNGQDIKVTRGVDSRRVS